MKTQRVLIADDNPLARRAVRTLLRREADFEVVAEAEDGHHAFVLAKELVPNIILMDLNMPHCDGLLATRLIKRELPRATIVILTVSGEAADLFEAIRSGAQGYLLKSLDPADWLRCLRNLARGEAIARDLARRIMAEFLMGPASEEPDLSLTGREQEVLRLIGAAMSNRQVAEALHISEQTVKNHIKSIMHKLHLKSRVELALHAQRLALSGFGVRSP